MKRIFVSYALTLILLVSTIGGFGCATKNKVNTPPGPDRLELIREQAERYFIYSDVAVKGVEALQASDIPIIDLARTLKELDTSNREQLKAAVAKTIEVLERLKPKVKQLAGLVLAELNRRGVTNVDIESLPGKVDFAYTVLDAAVRLMKTRL